MKIKMMLALLFASIVLGLSSQSASAHGKDEHQQKAPEMFSGLQTNAAKTVLQFHQALRAGQSEVVKKLLADNVTIFEGNGVERSMEEYASHHLLADIEFLKNMTITDLEHRVSEFGDMAFSVSRSQLKGDFKQKAIDTVTMETIVLQKLDGHWKIVHVHW